MSQTRRPDAHSPAMVKLCSERGKVKSDPEVRSGREQACSAKTINHVLHIDKEDTV